MTPITVSRKDLQKVLPPGKGAWENHASGSSVQLYEATKPDFAIVLVVRIVGQAFLMPNFETSTQDTLFHAGESCSTSR